MTERLPVGFVFVAGTRRTLVVPAGFLGHYRRVVREPATPSQLSDLLGLVGYEATAEQIERWTPERRAQAEVYAVNVHLRANDNICRKHPRPRWLPAPWQGPQRDVSEIREDLRGAFEGPGGTPVGELGVQSG